MQRVLISGCISVQFDGENSLLYKCLNLISLTRKLLMVEEKEQKTCFMWYVWQAHYICEAKL